MSRQSCGRAKGCQVALDFSLQRESMSSGGVEYKSVCNATKLNTVMFSSRPWQALIHFPKSMSV
jgi:hypothetical protein